MAKVLQVGDNNSLNNNTTEYGLVANCGQGGFSTTESDRQITYRTAGTLSNLWVYIESNSVNASTTIRIRINSADGNESVSIGSSSTGEFEDTSNTDSVSAGDEVNYEEAAGGSSGSLVARTHGIIFDADSNTVIRHAGRENSVSFDSGTEYTAIAGSGQHVSAEAEAEFDFNSAGTLKNLFMNVSSNGRSTASTEKSRINNADGNLAVSITASSTGIFEDTSNTDTISANDDVNLACTNGSGGGTLSYDAISTEFETTNSKFHSIHGVTGGINQSNNLTRYYQLGADGNSLSTEASAQAELNIAATVSNLWIYLSANSVNGSSTFDVRQDATSTAVTISIGDSTSGEFEDGSNSEALVAADLVNHRLVTGGSSGSLTWRVLGCMFENTEAGAAGDVDWPILTGSKFRGWQF